MSCTRSVRFELRRNTCRGWTQSNVILLAGEPGVETDSGQMKIGDGVRTWAFLPYVGKIGYGCGCDSTDPLCGRNLYTTGGDGSTGPTGPTGSADLFDYALVRNIGMNAYINHATSTYTYDQVSNAIRYAISIFGNGVYYDMNFSYSPDISVNSNTFSIADTRLYNNSEVSGEPNRVYNPSFTFNYPIPGNYIVTLDINTSKTGGIGNGSYFTFSFPIVIPQSDYMGIPDIIAPYIQLSIVGVNMMVSGIMYYGPGSYINISKDGLKLENIYNVVDNRNFNYITFGQSSYGSYPALSLEYVNGTGYSPFPHLNGNVNYFNDSQITLYITGCPPITANLRNAINKTNSLTFFPSPKHWSGPQTLIGYLGSTPDEINIPRNQNGPSSSAIATQQRWSISNTETNPQTPALSNIIPFNSSILTKYDPAYYPYDGIFHTNNFTTALNNTYILPQVATFNTGTKYLLLKLTTTGSMKNFTLNIGSSSTGFVNFWVYWTGITQGNQWFDYSIPYNSPGGCGNGFTPPSIFTVRMQTDAYANYTNLVGDVYINIQFNGQIKFSEVCIN